MEMNGRVMKVDHTVKVLADLYDRHLDDLKRFLRFESISALSQHQPDMVRTADWLVGYLTEIGLENAEVIQTAGHPVVYADWLHTPGAPTALIYGHYDVQPIDPSALWTTPPFDPQIREGRLFARGTADDKGQVMMHINAVHALLEATGTLPVNVKFLIEGEEEVGSPHLAPLMKARREHLKADFIVISDTSMIDHGVPTICTGLRGITGLEVRVTTASTDLHSGLYGGAAPNALHVLADMMASLHDHHGVIQVPGFYDDVVVPTNDERARYAKLPVDTDAMLLEAGVYGITGEPDYTPFERMTVRPTLELNGMWGGFTDEGSKTVIPKEASAKITCRLVPQQDNERIGELIKAHLEAICPPYARVEVEMQAGARAWRVTEGDPYVKAAVRALRDAFNTQPALAPIGGSIPVVETFDALFEVPIVLMGFADPDAHVHAPNERFSLEAFRLGREAIVKFWYNVSDLAVPV